MLLLRPFSPRRAIDLRMAFIHHLIYPVGALCRLGSWLGSAGIHHGTLTKSYRVGSSASDGRFAVFPQLLLGSDSTVPFIVLLPLGLLFPRADGAILSSWSSQGNGITWRGAMSDDEESC